MIAVLGLQAFTSTSDAGIGAQTSSPDTEEDTDTPAPQEPAPSSDSDPTPPSIQDPAARALPTEGDDTLIGIARDDDPDNDGRDRIDGLGGDDFIDGRGNSDRLRGGDGNDTVLGGNDNDTISGGAGDDVLSGQQGFDSIFGGDGNDTVRGGGGPDTAYGGHGDDRIEGNGGEDRLFGDEGMDTLIGNDGDDNLFDYSRFDGEETRPNTSVMDGGAGNDTLWFEDGSTVSGGADADLFLMYDDIDDALVTQITDFDPDEDVLRISVNVRDDVDNDDFRLEPRSDGTGSDLYLGAFVIAEIQSTDSFTLDDIDLVVLLDPEAGDVFYRGGSADADILGSFENNTVLGGDGDERILMDGFYVSSSQTGSGGADSVDGGAGDDTITGAGIEAFTTDVDDGIGNQTTLTLAQDTLNGGAGDDVIISRNGNILTGGDGADIFAIRQDNNVDDASGQAVPETIITDFDPDADTIVFSRITVPDPGALVFVPFPDGTGTTIQLGTQVLAQVTVVGGQPIGLENITPVDFLSNLAAR